MPVDDDGELPDARRRDLLYMGAALGTGLGGVSGTAGATDTRRSQETDPVSVRIEQGGNEWTIDAISYQDETIESFYNYRGIRASAATPTGIEEGEDTTKLFVYDGPNGLSLVLIHDYHNYPNSTESGGDITVSFEGLDGSWVIKDDGGDWDRGSPPELINWQWNDRNTDGGAFRFAGEEFSVTMDPEFTEGIDEFQALSGDAADPDRIDLALDEPVTIERQRVTFDWTPAVSTPDDELTFDAGDTEGEVASYEWSFGDGTSATGETATHSYENPDQYEVTLTIERPDGNEESRTERVPVAEEAGPGSDGVTAAFDYSPDVAVPQQVVSLDATESESTYETGIDTYEWVLSRDGSVVGQTTDRQTSVTVDEVGEYEVELRVVDDRTTEDGTAEDPPVYDATTATVAVEEAGEYAGFVVDETSPTELDQIRFTSGFADDPDTPAGDIEWAFGDGETATGDVVTHQYDSPGAKTVEMSVAGEGTFAKEVEVEQAPIKIDRVDRWIGGELLPGLPVPERARATVRTDVGVGVEGVAFDLVGSDEAETIPGDGDGVYEAGFDFADASPPAEQVQVRAVGLTADNEQIVHERTLEVPVLDPPDWLQFLLDLGSDLSVDVDDNGAYPEVSLSYDPLDNLGFGFDFPGDEFENEEESTVDAYTDFGADFYPRDLSADFFAAGGVDADLIRVAFSAELIGCATVTRNLQLQDPRADVSGEVGVTIPSLGPIPLSVPVPASSRSIGIEPEVFGQFAGSFEFQNDLNFDQGTVTPGAGLRINVTVGIEDPTGWAEVDFRIVLEGLLQAQFDVGTNDRNLGGKLTVSGDLIVDVVVGDASISGTIFEPEWKNGVDDPSDGVCSDVVDGTEIIDVGSGRSAETTVDLGDPAVGGRPPLPAVPSVDDTNGSVSADASALAPASTEVGDLYRLTDREYADTQPSVAVLGPGEFLVVWSSRDETKPSAAGRDVVARRFVDGEWEAPVSITDDTTTDLRPRVAATDDGRAIAVWSTLTFDATDADPDGIEQLLRSGEILYSIYENGSWSDPAQVTDSDRRQQRPTVTADGDGWLLAWQSLAADGGATSVEAARISDLGRVRLDSRSGAASPAVSDRSDDAADLAYVTVDDGAVTGVVHERLEGNTVVDETQYDDGGVKRVDVSDGRLLWSSTEGDGTSLREGSDGTVEDLPLREDVYGIRELSVTNADERAVVSYRANVEGSPNRDLVYRLDRGDGWIRDREIAGGPASSLNLWWSETALREDEGFLTAYAAAEPTEDATSDVFVTSHDFAPAYAIDGTVEDAAAGEETTVEYTVENRGDLEGVAPVTVVITGETETTAEHGPLAPGESATATATVTVPADGEIDLRVEADEPVLDTEPTERDLIAATPGLRIGDVDAVRTGEAAVELTVTVRNDGDALATGVPVTVRDGDTLLAEGVLDQLAPGATAALEATVDPTELDDEGTQTIALDPDGDHPDRAFLERTRETYLLRPDLSIRDVRYRSAGDIRFVEVTVSNAGPAPGSGTYRVLDADGQELAAEAIDLPAAVDAEPQYRRLRIQVPGLEAGLQVEHRIETGAGNLAAKGLSREDTVDALLPGTFFTLATYAGDDGRIDLDALRDAVDDWQVGRIETDLLVRVIDAWKSGDPVA